MKTNNNKDALDRVEQNGSEEGLIVEEKQSKEGRCSTPTGTRRSTAVPAWSAGRRSARRFRLDCKQSDVYKFVRFVSLFRK